MMVETFKGMYGASRKSVLAAMFCCSAGMAAPAFAHHSTAMYNYSVTKVLTGTVRQFQWTNPHSFVQVLVTGQQGAQEEWSIECGAPATMSMTGWTRDIIKPGDKLSISLAPLRDGSNGGTLRRMTLPNGKVLHGAADNFKSDSLGRPSGIDLPTLSRVPPRRP